MATQEPFRGWHMVAAAHVLFGLCFGAMYAFGAFFERIQDSFSAGRFSVAAVFSATALVYYVMGLFSGALADRFAVRGVVALGVALLASGFAFSSFATSLGALLLIYGALVGTGVGLIYIPSITVVQRWFSRHRSRATGLALAGTGVGTFVGPVAAGLMLQHLSWRTTMQCFAVAIALLGLTAATRLVGDPAQVGQHPDGQALTVSESGSAPIGVPLARALASALFWWYFGAIFLTSIGLFVALVHINPHARATGVDATHAAVLIGLIGAGNVLGRLLLGGLGDRIGPARLLRALTLALAVLPLGWWQAGAFWSLALFAVLFGACHGACIALYPSVASAWFGTRHLGSVLGALYIGVGLAALLGASAAGWVFDRSHSYDLPILASAISALLAVFFLHRARGPQ